MLRLRLPSPGTVIATIALIVALVGTAIAADVAPKVTKAKVRKIVAKEINRLTAAIAITEVERLAPGIANAEVDKRMTLEAAHVIGAPGEPSYGPGWATEADQTAAAFWKDGFGTVHLRGVPRGPAGTSVVFTLPPTYRPDFPVLLAPNFGADTVVIGNDGNLSVNCGASPCNLTLDAYTFRADG